MGLSVYKRRFAFESLSVFRLVNLLKRLNSGPVSSVMGIAFTPKSILGAAGGSSRVQLLTQVQGNDCDRESVRVGVGQGA